MRKIFSLLVLSFLLAINGCSCTKRAGEYKFHSLIYTLTGEEQIFSCSEEDKTDAIIKTLCSSYQSMSVELTKDGELLSKVDGEIKYRVWYKVEDNKLLVKNSENEEYHEEGKYENGTITMTVMGAKVVYKK